MGAVKSKKERVDEKARELLAELGRALHVVPKERAIQQGLFDAELFDRFAKGEDVMPEDRDRGMDSVANALERLADKIDDSLRAASRRSRRDREPEGEDEPESVVANGRHGRRGEVRQVAFEVKVRAGRDGKTLKGFVLIDANVRDDRDLEELADEVERRFRSANLFSPDRFGGSGYRGNGYGGGGWRDRGFDRDRDFRRY